MGRHSVLFSLICPACTITMGISLLSFRCFVAICLWCICTGIANAFISASVSASIRDNMLCFPGTTLSRIIATSCRRLDSRYNLFCLIPRALHTSCILIGMQHPSEKRFPSIHIPKVPLKIPHMGLKLKSTARAHPVNILGGQMLLML